MDNVELVLQIRHVLENESVQIGIQKNSKKLQVIIIMDIRHK